MLRKNEPPGRGAPGRRSLSRKCGAMYRLWVLIKERLKKGNRRLLAALSCYIMLIILACYLLLPARSRNDQFLLLAVVGFLTYLALKTLHHSDDE
jgi:hypothetical protein